MGETDVIFGFSGDKEKKKVTFINCAFQNYFSVRQCYQQKLKFIENQHIILDIVLEKDFTIHFENL